MPCNQSVAAKQYCTWMKSSEAYIRVFQVDGSFKNSLNLNMTNLQIRDGFSIEAGGAIWADGEHLSVHLKNMHFLSNSAVLQGGAVALRIGGLDLIRILKVEYG